MEVGGCLGPFLAASGHQVGIQKLEPEVSTLRLIWSVTQESIFWRKWSPQGSILDPSWWPGESKIALFGQKSA